MSAKNQLQTLQYCSWIKNHHPPNPTKHSSLTPVLVIIIHANKQSALDEIDMTLLNGIFSSTKLTLCIFLCMYLIQAVSLYFSTLLYIMKIISAQLTEDYSVLIRNHNRKVPLRNWYLRRLMQPLQQPYETIPFGGWIRPFADPPV